MKVSELIAQLQSAMASAGDLDVTIITEGDAWQVEDDAAEVIYRRHVITIVGPHF